MSDSAEVKRLWKVKKTLMQLCHDRGYLVTNDELNETLDEFKELYKQKSSGEIPLRDKMTMLFTHSNNKDKLYLFFPSELSLRKSTIVNYCQRMEKEGIGRGIIVAIDHLTPIAKKAFSDFSPRYILELFYENELLINIMDHELVPKHIVLTPEEKEKLFEKYALSENVLMRLLSNDPVVRYYGLRRGQVVKIIRNSDTAGRYVCYRLVS